jgi:FkbM family methyltransferase
MRFPTTVPEPLKSLLASTIPPWLLQPLKRRYYRAMLERQQESDQPEFIVIRELVRPGDVVVDVGANIGLFTYFLSRLVSDGGVVHGIEPVPVTYDILVSNVRGIGLRNVHLWNVAASDHEGPGWMEVPTYPGRSRRNFYRAAVVPDGRPTQSLAYRVRLTCLDTLSGVGDRPASFVKIDVEGHELAVIAGAMGLITASRPALLIEVTGDMDNATSSAAELSARLRGHGYEPYWIDGRRLRLREGGVSSVNYFFLRTDHLPLVQRFLEQPVL